METPEAAQKAVDYMDGGMIDKEKVEAFVSTTGRARFGNNTARTGGRRGGKDRNRERKRGGARERERRLAMENARQDDSGRRLPSRQGHGSRYARSPSPYRGRRMSRDRRLPVRSRSPYGRRYGGGGSRRQNRSPSPRYGGYRGGDRYARSRSFSRGRR
ncbi:hypothetical protein GGI20_000208 [Coemansia sp. BCRC 34301]|nr:hypothetical protein GGI20_000208 [Coemansia sp. BCRC 34301]